MVNFQESIRAKCITYLERAEKLKEYIKVVSSCCQMPMKHMESHHYAHYSSLMLKTMLVLRALTIIVTVSFGAPSGYHLFNLSVNFVTYLRFFATNTDKRAVCLGLFY